MSNFIPNTNNSHDQNGNTVMNLENFGFSTVVRFKTLEEGTRISEIDVVKAVCGKNSNDAGIYSYVSYQVIKKQF